MHKQLLSILIVVALLLTFCTPLRRRSLRNSNRVTNPTPQAGGCCLPSVYTYNITYSESFYASLPSTTNGTETFTIAMWLDGPKGMFREDRYNGQIVETEISIQTVGATYNYEFGTQQRCICAKERNPVGPQCISDPILEVSNIGSQKAIKYGRKNIKAANGVDSDFTWVVDAGNGNCWITTYERIGLYGPEYGVLVSETHYGHQTSIPDPSVFDIPSNCPSFSQCRA